MLSTMCFVLFSPLRKHTGPQWNKSKQKQLKKNVMMSGPKYQIKVCYTNSSIPK